MRYHCVHNDVPGLHRAMRMAHCTRCPSGHLYHIVCQWFRDAALQGGGVKRLFRKVDNKSSCYDPHHPGTVRRDGSFIYEEFLATGGTDVKVSPARSRITLALDCRGIRGKNADFAQYSSPLSLFPPFLLLCPSL